MQALREYKADEIAALPAESEIQYEFSAPFEAKMTELFEQYTYKRIRPRHFNMVSRRVIAAIIALIVMFSLSMSIKASRDSIVKFVYRIFNTNTSIDHDEDLTKGEITTFYTLPKIPESYKEIRAEKSQYRGELVWENEDYIISFMQASLRLAISSSADTEGGDAKEIMVNDVSVLFCNNGEYAICYWMDDDCAYKLLYPLNLGEDYIYQVIGHMIEW